MEEFDLYGDLELLHEEQKQNAIEDLKWKDKYKVALITIEKLQAENKDLKKKIKNLETNFASLFDTARTEIKRKDNLICELRKQKDDICFRRSKPEFVGREFNEKSDGRRDKSNESVHINPFSRQPKNTNVSNAETSKQYSNEKLPQTCESSKLKYSKANSRERNSRDVSQGREESREKDRRRNRSKDRSRDRNQSRDRIEERSRHRYFDRNGSKDRNYIREEQIKCQDKSNYKKEQTDNQKRKRHDRDASQTRGSDSSCEKKAKNHCHSPQKNLTTNDYSKVPSISYESNKIEEKTKGICNSHNDQPTDSKTELNQFKNLPSPKSEKRLNTKIEILQIEILKDVKEFKKNKLKSDEIPKPDPIDPVAATTEKSNTFLDALFDDSIMNGSQQENDGLYDDLIVPNQQATNLIPKNIEQENHLEKEMENHTPQRQPNTINLLDELFGPSPAGSLCQLETKQDADKYKSKSSHDSDFVLISNSDKSHNEKTLQLTTESKESLDENCSQTDKIINKDSEIKSPKKPLTTNLSQNDSKTDTNKSVKIDENFNFKPQTPQKQLNSKLMDDLFGQSPSSSIYGKKNSVTSVDESSSDFKFESNLNSVNCENEEKRSSSSSKTSAIVIDDNFADSNENVKDEEKTISSSSEKNTKRFKFVELDSSFYSSEDELNDFSDKSPPFENIIPQKKIKAIENDLIILTSKSDAAATSESTFKQQTKSDSLGKASRPEKQIESESSCFSSEKNKEKKEIHDKDGSREKSIFSKDSMFRSMSKENQDLSRCSRNEKDKNHHHDRKHKDHSQEASNKKTGSSSNNVSKNHRKNKRRHLDNNKTEPKSHNNSDSTSIKNEVSKARSSPILLYYDDDSAKDSLENHKETDKDQVFFLHCDNISSDEEVFEEGSKSKEVKDKSCNNDKPNKEDKIAVDEIKSNGSISEVIDLIDSSKKASNSISKHENRAIVDMGRDKSSLQPEVCNKDLDVQHVANATSNPRVDENIFNTVSSSVDLDKKEKNTCDKNTRITTSTSDIVPNCLEDVDDQQFSNHLQSTKRTLEKEENIIEEQKNHSSQIELISLGEIIENKQATHESPRKTDETVSLEKYCNGKQNVCSPEVYLNDKNIPNKKDKSELILNHDESNKSTSVLEKEQSNNLDTGKQNILGNSWNPSLTNERSKINFVQKFKGDKNSSDGELELCSESQTSDCQQSTPVQCSQGPTLPMDKNCETNSENLGEIKMAYQEANKEKEISKQITEEISITKTNDLISSSNSDERTSSYVSPQKLPNSGDELSSSYSNSELVTTGRRKKIKTPRKRTDICACKDALNGTTILISNQYEQSNVAPTSTWVQPEFELQSSEFPLKMISPNKNTEEEKESQTKKDFEKMTSCGALEKEDQIIEVKLQKEKPESGTISDLPTQNSENIDLSFSLQGKNSRNTEEQTLISPKTNDISKEPNPKTNWSSEQQKKDLENDKESSPMILPSSTNNEDRHKNTKSGCKKVEATRNLHTKDSTMNKVEKESPILSVPSQRNFSDPSSEVNDIEDSKEELNEKITETCSITIKRNKNKKKNLNNLVKNVETIPNENKVENTTLFCSESLENPQILDFKTEQNKKLICNGNRKYAESNDKVSDTIFSSSAALINTDLENPDDHQNEQQMMKHFMDSEYSLVGTTNYPAATYTDEVSETKVKEKRTKKLKLKINMSVDNSNGKLKNKSTECPSTYDTEKVSVKRKYKRKKPTILDSSNSSEDVKLLNDIKNEESKILSNDCDDNQILDEVLNAKPTKTNVRNRKVKHETKLENRDCELKSNSTETNDLHKTTVKRKYNKKSKLIADGSNCKEDMQVAQIMPVESKTVSNDKCEIKKEKCIESSKKRRYKRINLNSSLDSTDNSMCNELKDSPSPINQLESSIDSEKIIDNIHIPNPTTEELNEISHSSSETTNLRLEKPPKCCSEEKESNLPMNNSSPPAKAKDICNIKHEKQKRNRKRKISSETKPENVTVKSKKSKNSLDNSQSSNETSFPVSKDTPDKSNSITLTPTHHKIFLNDVFPNDPPPVYNAKDDDHQYHEIDDRLRCMFQSPSYTQPSNVEFPSNTKSDDLNVTNGHNVTIEETLNQSENILVDETLNTSERTKCDLSTGSRKVSLGSNEYVIESIGSHSANVFITRKKSKKRTKIVGTSV